MDNLISNLQGLVKALEGGQMGGVPGTQTQGSALMVEDLSPLIHNVCWKDDQIKLQKVLKVESCKSMLAQFDRQLDYGQFGGSAQLEGAVGQEETSSIVRATVPMCFYSHLRRTTIVADMVQTVDGKKGSDREAESATKKIAGDVEFDLFRGKADFSNGGVFDGNPMWIAATPNMLGFDAQIRQSDGQFNSRDLMFEEFGSNQSVVVTAGGVLGQDVVETAHTRSVMNHGNATRLLIDPLTLSAYNKTLIGAVNGGFAPIGQRIMLGGSAQDTSGADLRNQWVSGGEVVKIEHCRFLSGKTTWARTRATAPGVPTMAGGTLTNNGGATGALAAGTYRYIVTGVNEAGESTPCHLGVDVNAQSKITVGALASVKLAITAGSGTTRYFNVYRTAAGGGLSVVSYKFIGRVANTGTPTYFVDLGNKVPGFVTGFLVDPETAAIKELAPYSRTPLAMADLSKVEAHFRFLSLAVYEPRKNVIVDNIAS
jgi:hypothetical protein